MLAAVLATSVGCKFEPGSTSDDGVTHDTDASNGARTLSIRFANGGRGAVVNLPVPIALSPAVFDYAAAAADGSDLRFTDGSVTLPHEIEYWAPGDTSLVWVLVPLIDADSNTDFITLTYGDGQARAPDPGTLWGEHVAVFHLADDPAAATQIDDSSVNAMNASIVGMLEATSSVEGRSGRGLAFVDEHLVLGDEPRLYVAPGTARTFEVWLRTPADDRRRFLFANESSCEGWSLFVDNAGHAGARFAWNGCGGGGGAANLSGAVRIDDDEWHHVVLVVDRPATTARLYVDGVEVSSRTVSSADSANGWITRIAAGWDLDLSRYVGLLDEVRVSTGARDASWIGAAYAAGAGTLVTFE